MIIIINAISTTGIIIIIVSITIIECVESEIDKDTSDNEDGKSDTQNKECKYPKVM